MTESPMPMPVQSQLPRRAWYRSFPAMVSFAMITAVVVASVIVAIVLAGGAETPNRLVPSQRTDLAEWWSTAYPHVADLQAALDDSERALQQLDAPALTAACQRMHDAASVGIAAHLPAPDRDLSAELDAAAQDAHDAAHMCLAVVGHTTNSYDAEFSSHVEQADRHLKAAASIVNRHLTREPRWSARR